jgi:uncharacterized membrane protein YphA (DoxX/SURF4 family)
MSKLNYLGRTQRNTKDRGEGGVKSPFGTILILLSGILLYADKILDYLNIQIDYEFEYYNNAEVFVWVCSATVSPLLLIAGYWLKPRMLALASPLAAYSVQMMYIWRDEKWIQRDYFWYHTLAFMVGFILLLIAIRWILSRKSKTALLEVIGSLKSKIRYVVDKMVIDAPGHVKDKSLWEEEIVEPTLDKLNE